MHLTHHSRRQILPATISIVHEATDSFVENVELSLQLPRLYHKPLFLQRSRTAIQSKGTKMLGILKKKRERESSLQPMMIHSEDTNNIKRKSEPISRKHQEKDIL